MFYYIVELPDSIFGFFDCHFNGILRKANAMTRQINVRPPQRLIKRVSAKEKFMELVALYVQDDGAHSLKYVEQLSFVDHSLTKRFVKRLYTDIFCFSERRT